MANKDVPRVPDQDNAKASLSTQVSLISVNHWSGGK